MRVRAAQIEVILKKLFLPTGVLLSFLVPFFLSQSQWVTGTFINTLLFLAEGQGKVKQQGTEIPNLPHRELSSLSGLARETVTRVLTKLEKKGLIKREHDIMFIPDLAALERIIA